MSQYHIVTLNFEILLSFLGDTYLLLEKGVAYLSFVLTSLLRDGEKII